MSSNQIQVRVNKRIQYYSFRWDGTILYAYIKGEWKIVWRTREKRYGEFIFILATPDKESNNG